MNADAIFTKLKSLGVPAETIEAIEKKIDVGFISDIQAFGFKETLAKHGIDTSKLPDVDFADVKDFGAELMGKDVDGDGKTGIAEAIDTAQDALANAKEAVADSEIVDKVKDVAGDKLADAKEAGGGLMAKLKSFFGA